MKRKFRFILFLLTFIFIFNAMGTISYAVNLPKTTLAYGSKGQAVKEVQSALKKIGYNLSVDGIYGPQTKKLY